MGRKPRSAARTGRTGERAPPGASVLTQKPTYRHSPLAPHSFTLSTFPFFFPFVPSFPLLLLLLPSPPLPHPCPLLSRGCLGSRRRAWQEAGGWVAGEPGGSRLSHGVAGPPLLQCQTDTLPRGLGRALPCRPYRSRAFYHRDLPRHPKPGSRTGQSRCLLPLGLEQRSRKRGAKKQDAAIAERGRQAGAELGADPAKTVREITTRVLARVDATPEDALLATPAGSMTLGAYLPTRTFELTVHSLDLARTLDIDPPVGLTPAIAACCELAGALAARRPNAASILLTLTGRNDHALGASVL